MKIVALVALGIAIAASIAAVVLQLIKLRRKAPFGSWTIVILIAAILFIIIAAFNAVLVLRYF